MLKPTEEQEFIINFQDDLMIQAGPGSAKTTTALMKTEAYPDQNFLYLAFNKSVADEAKLRFGRNVKPMTAHGLAYRYVGRKFDLVKGGNLIPYNIKDYLDLKEKEPEEYYNLKLSSHIIKKFNAFCNSDKESIDDIHYDKFPFGDKAKKFVDKYADEVNKGAKLLWERMKAGDVPVTHDFYLKLFSLNPVDQNMDWVVLDEAQDAYPCIVNIVKRQSGKKLVVFDPSQRIYQWKSAVENIREYFDFQEASLSNSFRFNQNVADLCMEIARLKRHLGQDKVFDIKGVGGDDIIDSRAVLSRTNVTLFKSAVQYCSVLPNYCKFYFEGGLNTYLFVGGVSVYDLISLRSNNRKKIRSKFIKRFHTFKDLEEYMESSDDRDLQVMVNLVKEFGSQLGVFINQLKKKSVENKDEADVIFSTCHKSKGLEYGLVSLSSNDFITENQIINDCSDGLDKYKKGILEEAINIIYVAASRAKSKLIFPIEIFQNPVLAKSILKENGGESLLKDGQF